MRWFNVMLEFYEAGVRAFYVRVPYVNALYKMRQTVVAREAGPHLEDEIFASVTNQFYHKGRPC